PLPRPAIPGHAHRFFDHGAGQVPALVAEDRTVHALLARVVNELPPDEQGWTEESDKHHLLAGADELPNLRGLVLLRGVVPPRHGEGFWVAVFRVNPNATHSFGPWRARRQSKGFMDSSMSRPQSPPTVPSPACGRGGSVSARCGGSGRGGGTGSD